MIQSQLTFKFRSSPETQLSPNDIRSLITEIKDLKDQFEKLKMEWLGDGHSFAGQAEPRDKSITGRDTSDSVALDKLYRSCSFVPRNFQDLSIPDERTQTLVENLEILLSGSNNALYAVNFQTKSFILLLKI